MFDNNKPKKNKQYCKICKNEHVLTIQNKLKKATYKDVELEYFYCYYECENADVANSYSDEHLEQLNKLNLIDAYRNKKGLLNSKQIKDIRTHYKLTTSELSRLLGFRNDVVSLYETNLDQDNLTNNRLLNIKESAVFLYRALETYKSMFSNYELSKIKLSLLKEIQKKKEYFED